MDRLQRERERERERGEREREERERERESDSLFCDMYSLVSLFACGCRCRWME